jgi:hypothetical protein
VDNIDDFGVKGAAEQTYPANVSVEHKKGRAPNIFRGNNLAETNNGHLGFQKTKPILRGKHFRRQRTGKSTNFHFPQPVVASPGQPSVKQGAGNEGHGAADDPEYGAGALRCSGRVLPELGAGDCYRYTAQPAPQQQGKGGDSYRNEEPPKHPVATHEFAYAAPIDHPLVPLRGEYPRSGGRKKGTPNKDRAATIECIMRAADPIGFLCKVCNGDRMQAAEEREGRILTVN